MLRDSFNIHRDHNASIVSVSIMLRKILFMVLTWNALAGITEMGVSPIPSVLICPTNRNISGCHEGNLFPVMYRNCRLGTPWNRVIISPFNSQIQQKKVVGRSYQVKKIQQQTWNAWGTITVIPLNSSESEVREGKSRAPTGTWEPENRTDN